MNSTLTIHVNLTAEEEKRLIQVARGRKAFDEGFTFGPLRLLIVGDVTLAQESPGQPLRLTMNAMRAL